MSISEELAPKEGWESTEHCSKQSPSHHSGPWCGLTGRLLGIDSEQPIGALAKENTSFRGVPCLPTLSPRTQQQYRFVLMHTAIH